MSEPRPYRLLITGSRDLDIGYQWSIQNSIWRWIRTRVLQGDPVVIVDGGCPSGADYFARDMVIDLNLKGHQNVTSETHPADWSQGKGAGPARNQRMVDAGADQCVAFLLEGAGNRGTTDCASRAETAHIPTEWHGVQRRKAGA